MYSIQVWRQVKIFSDLRQASCRKTMPIHSYLILFIIFAILQLLKPKWTFKLYWKGYWKYFMGLPAHKNRFWIFRFKMCCLQIFSLKQQVSMVTNDKIMMSSVLQILKSLVFKSWVLIIPQIWLIFSLQGAPFI